MAVEVTFGQVATNPRGPWSADYNNGGGYKKLDSVGYDHDTWTSKVNNNTSVPGTDETKWFRNTDSGSAAYAAKEAADAAAQAAIEAAQAALDAVQISDLPAVATESAVREIVTGYTPS